MTLLAVLAAGISGRARLMDESSILCIKTISTQPWCPVSFQFFTIVLTEYAAKADFTVKCVYPRDRGIESSD